MDVQGLFWKVEYAGVGAGYVWSDNPRAGPWALEISFAF